MPAVLGGGIGGLSAAYYLSKRFIDNVTVFEATKRIGGWIRSEHHRESGYTFEMGPRTLRTKGSAGKNTIQLLEDLGLEKKVVAISKHHPANKNRMLYVNKKLSLLPSDLSGLFKTIPPFKKPLIIAALNDLFAYKPKRHLDDESIYDFTERRFGTDVAKYLVSSIICGICAGDAKEISVRFLMNNLFEAEQKYGSVINGVILSKLFEKKEKAEHDIKDVESSKLVEKSEKEKWSIYTLLNGLESLPQVMAEKITLSGVKIKINSECSGAEFHNKGAVITVNGNEILTDYVISALPSFQLAQLLEKQHPTLSYQLKGIPYADVAVVNVQYNSLGLLKYEGFGYLIPPCEKISVLGVIFDSCCFNMGENTVFTIMMGGRFFQDYFGDNPTKNDLRDNAINHLKTVLNIQRDPTSTKVSILRNCIPQYVVGHQARVNAIQKYIRNNKLPLALCGAPYAGVGINDVILSAKAAVNSVLENYSM